MGTLHTARSKSKIVIEVLEGEKTLNEIAAREERNRLPRKLI